MSDTFYIEIKNACERLNIKPTQYSVFVSICEQKLFVFRDAQRVREYNVSTSRAKACCIENSKGTPDGLHYIDGKIGSGLPIRTVFRGRVPCGSVESQTMEEQSKNLIISRIMKLRGLERGLNAGSDSQGRNVDTFSRYVYIHGTNQEDKIGTPNSHGCVLLSAADMSELFELVPDNSLVLISKGSNL